MLTELVANREPKSKSRRENKKSLKMMKEGRKKEKKKKLGGPR